MAYLDRIKKRAKAGDIPIKNIGEEVSCKKDTPSSLATKTQKIQGYEINEVYEKTPGNMQARKPPASLEQTSIAEQLTRLTRGFWWLADQQEKWNNGDPTAASDEKFSEALAAWDEMEAQLRRDGFPLRCIFGGGYCPPAGVVKCSYCALGDALKEESPEAAHPDCSECQRRA